MAGHSKWANIKHRKAVVDARRGKLFTRISREIIVAARLGGGDPEANARLRFAITNARSVSMPLDNIKRAIQRGTGEIEGAIYEEAVFEGYGPGGVAVIVSCTTENRNRTVADIRATFSKYGGNLGETNSVAWNFTYLGEVEVRTSLTEEQLLETALEAGADDVIIGDETSTVICSPDTLGRCASSLTEAGIDVVETRFTWIPTTTVPVTDLETAKKLLKMLDVFEENDDVQNVVNNASIDDVLVDALS